MIVGRARCPYIVHDKWTVHGLVTIQILPGLQTRKFDKLPVHAKMFLSINMRDHLSHKNALAALTRLNACLLDVQRWMSLSKLKLNPEKTEFIVFGSKSQRQKLSSYFPVSIFGSLIHPVDSVRNLGVWFDAEFSFSGHVKRTCKACFLQMRDLLI